MGVDCDVYLPDRVRVRDVADVLAALGGNPMVRMDFQDYNGWSAHNPAVKIEVCPSVPEMVMICFVEPGTGDHRAIYYHFESDAQEGSCRVVSMRSRARNIAYAVGLVDFFGGTVDFNDCDDIRADYAALSPPNIRASDGEEWYDLQNRKLAVTPVTPEQIAQYDKFASYRG